MQKQPFFRRLLRWVGMVLGIILLLAVGYFAAESGILASVLGQNTEGGAEVSAPNRPVASTEPGALPSTVPLRSASSAVGMVSAAGNLALAAEQQVVVEVGGLVSELMVNVGDTVEAGDLLVVLDSQEAERAVEQALLDQVTAQTAYNDELDGGDPLEIAAAEATLRSAQENLADVIAGPSASEIAAARASLAAAQAAYADLEAGPSEAELTQLSTAIRKAEVTLQEAQSNYDAIAWRNDAGMTSEAAELQNATLDYEDAKAAYEQATASASTSDLQSALSSIQSAQETLDSLLAQPNAAAIADAEAQVASAESSLKQLQAGGNSAALETARVQLAQAQLALDNAVADLANTEIRATMAGTILSLNLARGQQVSSGTVAVTLADVNNLELTVNVAEVDIEKVQVGQAVEITLDALPGQSFAGVVSQMSPASDPEQSVVNYPVTIQLTDDNFSGVRSGMTAVATLQNEEVASGWLAPRNAVETVDGRAQIAVVRDGQTLTIPVTTGSIQGEWVVVESPELQAGDAAVGSVTSLVNEDSGMFFGPPGGGDRAPGGGGGAVGPRP
jgi:HlyD family secretion protein